MNDDSSRTPYVILLGLQFGSLVVAMATNHTLAIVATLAMFMIISPVVVWWLDQGGRK